MTDRVADLSEGQKSCLRLVARGMSSKEIAIQTGLSPSTVDTYLKLAITRLDAANRRDAARILAQAEVSQKSGSQSLTLAGTTDRGDDGFRTGATGWRKWSRLPPVGGSQNDLAWDEKTFRALQVAVVGASIALGIALAIAGLLQILR